MTRTACRLVLLALLAGAAAPAPETLPNTARIAQLRDAARGDTLAYELTESLTTEIGPRLAGSDAEARARAWAVARLTGLGFRNVHVEPFTIPGWSRGAETAEVTAPFPQKLAVTALGGSGATPPAGLTLPVVAFEGLAAFRAADPASVKGRIVFINHHMGRTQDGSSYGPFGDVRREGPSLAAAKGAAAIVIRSAGTDDHRVPHTGETDWADGQKPIPAAALSIPDADQLARIVASGKPVTLHLLLTPRFLGPRPSGNVVAEVPGRDPSLPVVLVGGHLDSWDLGTGAIDDGTGVGITVAAAKRVMDAGRPLRTIRVVLYGSEEPGLLGGLAYRKAHPAAEHFVVAESDFGADRVWKLSTHVALARLPWTAAVADLLEPLGIAPGDNLSHGDSDVEPLALDGAPVFALGQDGTRYFDIHHTADDTLDKVDPEQLRQNVAAWVTVIAAAADEAQPLGPPPAYVAP